MADAGDPVFTLLFVLVATLVAVLVAWWDRRRR